MLSNKAGIPIIKTILIIFVSSFVLISFLIVLVPYTNFYVDDKKIDTQLSLNKILNCFSEEIGIIDSDKYEPVQLNSCLKNQENILVKVSLEGKNNIYLNNKEEDFINNEEISCKINSNILCTKMAYPVLLKEKERDIIKILEVTIITK